MAGPHAAAMKVHSYSTFYPGYLTQLHPWTLSPVHFQQSHLSDMDLLMIQPQKSSVPVPFELCAVYIYPDLPSQPKTGPPHWIA